MWWCDRMDRLANRGRRKALQQQPGQRSLPFVEAPFERAALHDVRLRAIDLRLDGNQFLEGGCAVDAVRQSKIQAGIHRGLELQESSSMRRGSVSPDKWQRSRPLGLCRSK